MSQSPDQNPFLIARPTDEAVICRVESQTEVASSAAFQSVDDQYFAGKLTSTEVAVLKARYMKLHDALRKTRDNEFSLIQLSKRYMSEIDDQEQELARADQFPDNTITEPSQMRAQILGYYNSAMETDERVEMLAYEAGLLREERKLLNRDYSKLPTAELEALDDDVDIFAEMERRLKLVQTQCQDLWLEIDMLKMEGKRSREQYRQAADAEQEAQHEAAEMNRKLSDVKAEWVLACDLPGQYSKEAEKARKYKSNTEKELLTLQQEFSDLSDQQTELELQVQLMDNEEFNNRKELAKLRLENTDKKELLEKTIRNHDTWYEMEMMNRTEKARYLQRIHLADQDKRELAEEINKLTKERDALVRQWKKSTIHMEFLSDSVRIVQQLHDKTRARYVVTPRYDGEMTARKRRLARSIQNLQQELEEEKKRTITEMAHVGRTVGVTERRLSVLEHLRAENWELIRLTTSLSEGLSRAIDEYTAARSRFERLLEELGQIMAETREQQRVLDELASRLADVSNLYTKMKLERNKCVSLLQASVKMALDTRERLRIHANEAEIIIYRLQRHDQELIHERTLFGNAIVQRDHKRNEVCKMLHIHSEQIARREQMRRSIHRINLMFNQTESETLSLKKAKERCAQMRNERAILLIERNQEVYILQERIAAQDAAARYAGLTLRAMREECEFLRRYRNHLSRYIWVVNNKIPVHQNLTTKLHGLIHELVGSRMELARLVEQAEDPDIPGRLRLLGGKDPSQNELWITLGKLERRMAAKEEDMAEKNLTYEAVCRLVDSLQVRATAGKEDTLTLATEVNKIKARLLYMKNQMKTIYAELVVCGAERNDLKQQVLNLEKKLDVYNLRMRLGHAPSPTLERKLRSNMRIARLKQVGRCGEPIAIQPMRLPGTMPNKPFDPMANDHRKSTSSDTRPVRGKSIIQRVEREGSAAKLRRSSHGSGLISQDVHLPPITNTSSSRMTNESQENRTTNENQSNMNLSNIMTVLPALGSSQLALNRNLSRSQTSTWRAYKNGVNVRSGEENMEVDRPSSTPFSSPDVTMSEENFDHSETNRNDQETSLEHIVLSCRIQSPTRESSSNDGRMNTPENSQLKPPGRVESPEREH